MDAEITLAGERLVLLREHAVHWPARRALLIADPHFGKDDHFRRAALALPRGPTLADLERLSQLVGRLAVERVIVLGDFLHARVEPGDDFPRAFVPWLERHAGLRIDIVAGNHDRHVESRPRDAAALRWFDGLVEEPPFVLSHEPVADPRGIVLAGHVHPVYRDARLFGARSLRGYWLRRGALVLPAFGEFTGGFRVKPAAGEQFYVATPDGVLRLF